MGFFTCSATLVERGQKRSKPNGFNGDKENAGNGEKWGKERYTGAKLVTFLNFIILFERREKFFITIENALRAHN
jgi:hypothetical protein